MTHLIDLLEDAAGGHGHVQFLPGDVRAQPFAGLWRESESSARWFATTVGSRNVVAMVLTNSRACAVALLGAWRAGCTVASLPLPGRAMVPEQYVGQLRRFTQAAGASHLLLDGTYAGLVQDSAVSVFTFEQTLVGGFARDSTRGGRLFQYTSGSIGAPKGIDLSLEAVGSHVESILAALEIRKGDSACSWLPLSHDMGLIGMFLAPIVAGARRYGHANLTLLQPERFVLRPMSWLRTCSTVRATVTVIPNFALDFATRAAKDPAELDLSAMRICIVGSEPVRAESLEGFETTFAAARFNPLAFCPAYGMAEACLSITMVRPDEEWRAVQITDDEATHGSSRSVVSTGQPLEGTAVRISSGRTQGEIEFRSTSQLTAYVGSGPTLSDDGYFRTGDLGFKNDGELFVLGRADDVLVVEGRNIYPEDVEHAVTHRTVRDSCVAAVATPAGGFAVVVEPRRTSIQSDDLKRACREIRRMVAEAVGTSPTVVAFVQRGSLPKTPSGKVRRFAVRQAIATEPSTIARIDS